MYCMLWCCMRANDVSVFFSFELEQRTWPSWTPSRPVDSPREFVPSSLVKSRGSI